MTTNKLPFLHRNARSRQITSAEALEVFSEEVVRGIPSTRNMSQETYLKAVLP